MRDEAEVRRLAAHAEPIDEARAAFGALKQIADQHAIRAVLLRLEARGGIARGGVELAVADVGVVVVEFLHVARSVSSPLSFFVTRWMSRNGSVGRPRRCENTSIQNTSPFFASNVNQSCSPPGIKLAGHFAGRRDLLGLRGLVVRFLFEHDRRGGEAEQHGIGHALGRSSRYSKPSTPASAGRTRRPVSSRRARSLGGISMSTVSCSSGLPSMVMSFDRFAAGKVAAVEREVRLRAGQTGRRQNEVEPRPGRKREAIEIIVAAAIEEVGDLQQIGAIGGRDEIDQTAGALALQFAAGWCR